MNDKLILNTQEAADLLCCSTDKVCELARDGSLPGLKFGEGWIFPLGPLLEAINDMALVASRTRRGIPQSATLAILPAPNPPPKSVYPQGNRTRPDLSRFTSLGGLPA
jgi:excisionase family DNA binding protein